MRGRKGTFMGIIAECKQCLQEYDAKRSTSLFCSPKCKQAFYRNRMKGVTVTLTTNKETKSVTVTDKPKPYQMTVMERLFYRPAHLLKPGETNFVSLPGRACYGVV